MCIVLFVTMCFSGCTTPGTNFDTVKVVASITRNGGDYKIAPTGESGYAMHVVIGTLSISALGMDINEQKIKNAYKINTNNYAQYYRNLYGKGLTARFKAWLQREKTGGMKLNSVSDLQQATDTGETFGFSLPDIQELGITNFLGQPMESFGLSNGTYKIPDFGLGIYSATIPPENFKDGVTPGYLVLNDPINNPTFNGIHVYVDGKEDHKNTAFVVYDGNYKVVVLTNEPATLDSDSLKSVSVSLELIKVDLPKASDAFCSDANTYWNAYGDGLKAQLMSGTTSLLSNMQTAVDSAISQALDAIPGGQLVKSFDSVSKFFVGPTKSIEDSWSEAYFMDRLKNVVYPQKDSIYKNSWGIFRYQMNGVHYLTDISGGVNIDDGISSSEWTIIEQGYFGYNAPVLWWVHYNPIVDPTLLENQIFADDQAYINSHGLNDFYTCWTSTGTLVPFSGPVFSMQIINNSFLAIFDTKTMAAMKSLLNLKWDDTLTSITAADLDKWRSDLTTDITTTVQQLIPDYIATQLTGIQENFTSINNEIQNMNSEILETQLQLTNLQTYIKTLLPTTPSVAIFAYEVPLPVFTEIVSRQTGFLQADPTSVFSAACSVSIGKNWTLSPGYPRAVVITESKGTLYVPLQQDPFTGSWVLRQDMVGVENLTIGDTIRTYFEAKATNGTANLTSKTNVYYTRVVRNWLSEEIDRLGLIIDNMSANNSELQQALDYLTNQNSPFSGGNTSQEESFFATLTVKDDSGNDLYVLSPTKNFKMKENDSQVLSWDVTIYQGKPYNITIVLGNSTTNVITHYSTGINKADVSFFHPTTWWTGIKRYFKTKL